MDPVNRNAYAKILHNALHIIYPTRGQAIIYRLWYHIVSLVAPVLSCFGWEEGGLPSSSVDTSKMYQSGLERRATPASSAGRVMVQDWRKACYAADWFRGRFQRALPNSCPRNLNTDKMKKINGIRQ